MKGIQQPNKTLNLLIGLREIMYDNFIEGASNTIHFLNFFGEASEMATPLVEPAL